MQNPEKNQNNIDAVMKWFNCEYDKAIELINNGVNAQKLLDMQNKMKNQLNALVDSSKVLSKKIKKEVLGD